MDNKDIKNCKTFDDVKTLANREAILINNLMNKKDGDHSVEIDMRTRAIINLVVTKIDMIPENSSLRKFVLLSQLLDSKNPTIRNSEDLKGQLQYRIPEILNENLTRDNANRLN